MRESFNEMRESFNEMRVFFIEMRETFSEMRETYMLVFLEVADLTDYLSGLGGVQSLQDWC